MDSKAKFIEACKNHVNNPDFQKPLSELNKDFTKKGVLILVTRIKP